MLQAGRCPERCREDPKNHRGCQTHEVTKRKTKDQEWNKRPLEKGKSAEHQTEMPEIFEDTSVALGEC
jgi:hypothetical protein